MKIELGIYAKMIYVEKCIRFPILNTLDKRQARVDCKMVWKKMRSSVALENKSSSEGDVTAACDVWWYVICVRWVAMMLNLPYLLLFDTKNFDITLNSIEMHHTHDTHNPNIYASHIMFFLNKYFCIAFDKTFLGGRFAQTPGHHGAPQHT